MFNINLAGNSPIRVALTKPKNFKDIPFLRNKQPKTPQEFAFGVKPAKFHITERNISVAVKRLSREQNQ